MVIDLSALTSPDVTFISFIRLSVVSLSFFPAARQMHFFEQSLPQASSKAMVGRKSKLIHYASLFTQQHQIRVVELGLNKYDYYIIIIDYYYSYYYYYFCP